MVRLVFYGLLLARGMSSTDLNSEDYFSDHPKRLPSFDGLFRAQAELTPERFFRSLERQFGDHQCSQDDYRRAVFLFRRLQSARRTVSKLILFVIFGSLVPFVGLALPEEWRLGVFTGGIVLELLAGASFYLARSRWQDRRRDYCHWLRLVHRRMSNR